MNPPPSSTYRLPILGMDLPHPGAALPNQMTGLRQPMTRLRHRMTACKNPMTLSEQTLPAFANRMTALPQTMTALRQTVTAFGIPMTAFQNRMTAFANPMTGFWNPMTAFPHRRRRVEKSMPIRLPAHERQREGSENSPVLQHWEKRRRRGESPARDGRTVLPSLAGLCFPPSAIPSDESRGYFHRSPLSTYPWSSHRTGMEKWMPLLGRPLPPFLPHHPPKPQNQCLHR